jgi:hypothetical protein
VADEPQVFNGIDGSTGEYLQDPLALAELARMVLPGAPPPGPTVVAPPDHAHMDDLRALNFRSDPAYQTFTPAWTVDPKDLATAGWGVIFAHDAPAALRDAVRELLDHRKAQAGRVHEGYYWEYVGPDGHRPGETKQAFLARHKVTNGMPADPRYMPYYLLIVDDPERIPYRFQYQLDVEYAVGRLWFETPDGKPDLEAFAQYCRSVVAAETGGVVLPRRAAFVGVRNPGDGATRLSEEELVRPLPAELKAGLGGAAADWDFVSRLGPDAIKDRIAELLGGADTPALLFTASHGMGLPLNHPRQLRHQGALICQDWPGPSCKGELPEDYFFAADDVPASAKLLGLVAFHFACYGAGTPRLDDFPPALGGRLPRAGVAPRAFVARLPQRLLGHPNGGALAVVGHVERAWTTSFLGEGRIGRQVQAFADTLGRLLQGYPVGYAMEAFNIRYAALSEALKTELREIEYGAAWDDVLLSGLWLATTDVRNYAVLGDPAVRLMVKGRDPPPSGRT